MAYPWTVVGTAFNARYGFLSEKEVDGVCNTPKKRKLPALCTYKTFAKTPYFVKTWRKLLSALIARVVLKRHTRNNVFILNLM